MKGVRSALAHLRPWSGLLVGIIAFAAVHQFGSDGAFNDCSATVPGPTIIVALLGLVACLLAALASWLDMAASAGGSRRIIASISFGSAVLFVFAILIALAAALLLPPCFR